MQLRGLGGWDRTWTCPALTPDPLSAGCRGRGELGGQGQSPRDLPCGEPTPTTPPADRQAMRSRNNLPSPSASSCSQRGLGAKRHPAGTAAPHVSPAGGRGQLAPQLSCLHSRESPGLVPTGCAASLWAWRTEGLVQGQLPLSYSLCPRRGLPGCPQKVPADTTRQLRLQGWARGPESTPPWSWAQGVVTVTAGAHTEGSGPGGPWGALWSVP